MSDTKACSTCRERKPLDEFPRRTASPGGYAARCRTCQSEATRRYRKRLAARTEIEVPSTKTCRVCKQTLPSDAFGKRPSSKDGLRGACRSCRSVGIATRRQALQDRKMIIPPKEKTCPSCQETKPSGEYYRSRSEPSGLQCYCKACFKERRTKRGRHK